ncbi:retrovirus-related pol polyprotein from transposon TNT 1-94 [Tanacetum coccineum]
MKKIMISTDLSLKNHDSSMTRLEQKVNHLAQLISTHKPKNTLMPKIDTFGEGVKKLILKENKETTTAHDKPKQQLQKVVSHEIKELLGSFILPCIIGDHSMSNALADLGASISVIPYSLFKRLGLGSLKLIKMTIEIADRSMQSSKGIKENVLVKISNLVFLVDFFVLDIMEYENVPIILGRPMLVTAHAKIDVYELAEIKKYFGMTLCDPDKRMIIGLEDFVDIDDMWDDLDPGILTNEKSKTEFLKSDVSDEDKKKGIHKPEKKIKGFYRGCLSLGNEYKYAQEVVDWIQGCISDGMT